MIRLFGIIGRLDMLRRGLALSNLAGVFERAFELPDLKAVALAVNSPGGSPVQSALIARRIRALAAEHDVPVFAFAEDVAASGGYWLLTAADEIYADESSIIGSIGVVTAGFGFPAGAEAPGYRASGSCLRPAQGGVGSVPARRCGRGRTPENDPGGHPRSLPPSGAATARRQAQGTGGRTVQRPVLGWRQVPRTRPGRRPRRSSFGDARTLWRGREAPGRRGRQAMVASSPRPVRPTPRQPRLRRLGWRNYHRGRRTDDVEPVRDCNSYGADGVAAPAAPTTTRPEP